MDLDSCQWIWSDSPPDSVRQGQVRMCWSGGFWRRKATLRFYQPLWRRRKPRPVAGFCSESTGWRQGSCFSATACSLVGIAVFWLEVMEAAFRRSSPFDCRWSWFDGLEACWAPSVGSAIEMQSGQMLILWGLSRPFSARNLRLTVALY